jgi:hypothetical protein
MLELFILIMLEALVYSHLKVRTLIAGKILRIKQFSMVHLEVLHLLMHGKRLFLQVVSRKGMTIKVFRLIGVN